MLLSFVPLVIVDLICNLHTIKKEYHPSRLKRGYCSTYTEPNFIPDPHMRRKESGRLVTTRLHNEIDQPIHNKAKKCSYYHNEGHNRGNCLFRQ